MSPHRMDFQRAVVESLPNRYIADLMSLGHMNYRESLDSDYLQRSLRWHPKITNDLTIFFCQIKYGNLKEIFNGNKIKFNVPKIIGDPENYMAKRIKRD